MEGEVARGGSVRVERWVRPTTPHEPPEYAARLALEAIVCAKEITLTDPKENIRSYCPKTGDGLLGDVEGSLIMPGAELQETGKAVKPFLKTMI